MPAALGDAPRHGQVGPAQQGQTIHLTSNKAIHEETRRRGWAGASLHGGFSLVASNSSPRHASGSQGESYGGPSQEVPEAQEPPSSSGLQSERQASTVSEGYWYTGPSLGESSAARRSAVQLGLSSGAGAHCKGGGGGGGTERSEKDEGCSPRTSSMSATTPRPRRIRSASQGTAWRSPKTPWKGGRTNPRGRRAERGLVEEWRPPARGVHGRRRPGSGRVRPRWWRHRCHPTLKCGVPGR